MGDFSPYFTIIPVTIGILALFIGTTRRQYMLRWNKIFKQQKKAEQARELIQSLPEHNIPEGCVFVQQGSLYRKAGLVLSGTSMLTSAGSPAAKQQLNTLITHYRAGLADNIGSVLFFECDSTTRLKIQQSIPEIYLDRTLFSYAQDYPNGFGNLAPEEVEENIGRWGVPLRDAIERVAKLHEERNGAKPGEILLFTSL